MELPKFGPHCARNCPVGPVCTMRKRISAGPGMIVSMSERCCAAMLPDSAMSFVGTPELLTASRFQRALDPAGSVKATVRLSTASGRLLNSRLSIHPASPPLLTEPSFS